MGRRNPARTARLDPGPQWSAPSARAKDEPKDMQGRPAHERSSQNPPREREREMDDDMRDDALERAAT
ncbi:hypothetical protein OTB20_17185 [Streptomyces sp. H27-H1]|uniref:hypothetical protein n=1 Tax=Streptomyces sp. H27-H1 TaxID=2996461 RepID=UPI00226F410C|nr:hypothetical protein [Streptomyces sp. H27-H1]MCY0927915.1 hypothetical protein [Streptomyces sp. H27-H1]